MRTEFTPTSPRDWQQHFELSKGDLFVGDRYQRGGSVGSFLRGLLRFVIPVVKSAGSVVAKEALRTGAAIAGDVAEGKLIKDAALERVKEGAEKLAQEALAGIKIKAQRGKGLGKRPRNSINTAPPPAQKKRKKQKEKPKKQKEKLKKQDVFGFY